MTRVKCLRRTWRKDSTITAFIKVKICERIGPGFLSPVEFLHRKVGWNAEGFSWTHDPTHWQWPTGLVSTVRSNSSERSGKSLWHLDRKRQVKVCVTVPTVLMNKKHNSTDHWLAQHHMLDKTDQKHNTQRKKQRDSCLVQRVPRSVCSNVCASITTRHPYSAGVILSRNAKWDQGVTDANWAGELEGLRLTSCGSIHFGEHLLEKYSSTQQIVSTAESEYISITKGAAHALEVRSAVVEFGLTFNVVCETDASAGRAMATRRGVGHVRHLDARLLWLQQLCAEGVVQVRARPGELKGKPGNKDGRFEANDWQRQRQREKQRKEQGQAEKKEHQTRRM